MRWSTKSQTWLLAPLAVLMIVAVMAKDAWGYDVKEVQIFGNQAFSQGQIKKLMKTKGSSWYKKRPFIRRVLELDLANIEAFYRKDGFLDCSLSVQELPPMGRNSITLQIHIQEGLRTMVSEVQFAGNEKLSAEQLGRIIATQIGHPMNLTQLRLDTEAMAAKYGNMGYPYAQVSADVERQGTQAQVMFHVQEGSPVQVGQIRYVGLRKVKTSVVRRELTFKPGDSYNRSAILDSRQRIYSTGLFRLVNIQMEAEAIDSLSPNLRVMVQEKPMRWMGLKSDVGQDEQYDMTSDLTAEWGHKNLFATGRRLSLKAIASFRVFTEWENLKNRLEVTYTEPWFLGRRMPALVSLYYEPGLKSKGRSYSLSRELGWFSRAWLTLKYERVDIFGLEPAVAEILRKAAGERIRRNISLSWERDTRDHIFEPTRGSLAQVFVEFVGGPLGGDDHYVKNVISWNRYQALFRPVVLASRMKLGWGQEHGAGVELPPDARFYAGGATTVRGLAERSLGSMDPAGNPLGGIMLLLFNLELRRVLWRRLGGSIFFDVGNVWSQPEKAAIDQLKTATGLEAWFSSPVGPVRVDYGVPLAKDLENLRLDRGRWHLAILFAF
jgi:outer membrane protein insertion porin family